MDAVVLTLLWFVAMESFEEALQRENIKLSQSGRLLRGNRVHVVSVKPEVRTTRNQA